MRQYIILFSALLILSCSGNQTETTSDQVVEILPVQDIRADEIAPLIGSFAGEKAILLNVWATWCIPCIEEFPYITRVQNEHPEDLQVIFISADFPEEIDRIHGFLADQGVDWQTYLKNDRDEPFIDAVWKDWSGAIPATVIYNKDGSHLTFFERTATYDEFKTLVLQAINNN